MEQILDKTDLPDSLHTDLLSFDQKQNLERLLKIPILIALKHQLEKIKSFY